MSAATGTVRRRRLAAPPLIALALMGVIGIVALRPVAPPPPDPVVLSRTLLALVAPDGTLTLRDAASGAVVARFPGDRDSFVRGTIHALDVHRARLGVPDARPFRLVSLRSGRLLLLDHAAGSTVELAAFGSANAASFARLLPAEDRP